ncbi:MAG: NADH-quinone oxidoreductase subunit NuoF [Acidobacteria bacterium]|nr:NADH-quinone oxidoreductase subunit NuoF [Acidobacteriota bacterium]MBI3658315.1 NADH-quinone oxidoreductase subunit NuoF [Acidobacteriota bacterium]
MLERVLTKNWEKTNSHKIETYMAGGGYEALRQVLTGGFTPEQVIEEVKKSNLRGRGGAGFPTGVKWSFVPKDPSKPKYMVVNADESEPGTFKDRYILERDPHMLIEGLIIGSYAIGAKTCFIYVRGEYYHPAQVVEAALAEAYRQGFLGNNLLGSGYSLEVFLIRGAGAYICGEETALLESLEGKKGWPRLKPPFPAVVGLYKCPTVINNVETLANIPHIIRRGGQWYAGLGPPKNGGTRLFALSGHVNRPGVYELPLGITLREMIYDHAGGIRDGKVIKAVIPGGSSAPVLTAAEIDVKMDHESVAAIGSMLGSGAVIIMDETTCMVKALARITKFYAHESCGQCTPCREGTGWMLKILRRILQGEGHADDPDHLLAIQGNIQGMTICPLGDAAALPVQSFVTKFRQEFDYHCVHKRCDIESACAVPA